MLSALQEKGYAIILILKTGIIPYLITTYDNLSMDSAQESSKVQQ